MAAPLNPANLDHAVALYLAGKTLQEIRSASGVSASRLCRERAVRGIPPRGLDLPDETIVRQYLDGASEYGLSQQYGVSRGSIERILRNAGAGRRGMSEAGLVRSSQMGEASRKAQVEAANKATRMRRVPEIERFRAALLRERKGRPGSVGEVALLALLQERGLNPTVERAVGPYNVDLAVLPVAVEVLGGGFHGVKARHAERTPYILDAGWHLVMVWNYEGCSALGSGAADYLVAFFDQVRRNPPATSQYRVVTGQGQVLAACGREDNQFPLVPPPRGRL